MRFEHGAFLLLLVACTKSGETAEPTFDTDADTAADTDIEDTDPDPNDVDDDHDGFTENEGDCDDDSSLAWPGAPDDLDGTDSNCDGESEIVWEDDTENPSAAGRAVAGGDLDGDGALDVVVGAPTLDLDFSEVGAAYVVFGPLVPGQFDLEAVGVRYEGTHETTVDSRLQSGRLVAVADVAGDSTKDLVIASLREVYVITGPLDRTVTNIPDAALAKLAPEGFQLPSSLATGDVDGDGRAELLIGAYGEANGKSYAGMAYVLDGPPTPTTDLADARMRLLGESDSDLAGSALAVAGDTDGDGLADILVGAPSYQSVPGKAYLVSGEVRGTLSLAEADATMVGDLAVGYAGTSVAGGDVDGDGFADLLVGTPGNGTEENGVGSASLLLGPVSGALSLATADARFITSVARDRTGMSVVLDDLDRDGGLDVVVGAPGIAHGYSGQPYVVTDPGTGVFDLDDVGITIESHGPQCATVIASIGDVDGDGRGDLALGDEPLDGAGTAWLWFLPP